jgi:hypothetical protein
MESQVPAKQELPALRSGDPGTLEIALQGLAMNHPDADYGKYKEAILYAIVKVGLRAENYPAAEEKALLYDHMRKEYGNHTPAEIKLAFDMAIAGRLDIELKYAVCYENFSCMYVSIIMNAYRKWAAEEYKQIPQQPPEKVTEKVDKDSMDEWWDEFCIRVRTGNCTYDFVPMMLVEWMEKKGKMTIAPTAQMDYLVKAMEYRFNQLQKTYIESQMVDDRRALTEFGKMREKGEFTGKHIDYLKNLAKRIQLHEMAKTK